MSIIDIILIGISYILAGMIIIMLIGTFFLLTWMQVEDERKDSHEAKEPEVIPAPTAQRRRRRTACGYQGQVS